MERDWILQQGFETLVQQIETRIEYATFSGHPIIDYQLVDIAMRVLMRQGLFATQYEQWHARANTEKRGGISNNSGPQKCASRKTPPSTTPHLA